MFKVYISCSEYDKIVITERQLTTAGGSNLYKLLQQQLVQVLTEKDTERFKSHLEVGTNHKLAFFYKGKGWTRQMLTPMVLITESCINGNSTPPLKMIDQTIKTLRDFSNSLSILIGHKVYLYAVNGKRMEECNAIRNRLIK